MKLIMGLMVGLGLICLFYYGIIINYAGTGTSFAWFWLMASIGFEVGGLVLYVMDKYNFVMPKGVKVIILSIILIGFSIFAFVEVTLIYYANQKANPNVEYMIILGAQVRGTVVSRTLKKRLDTAEGYLKENLVTKVIVSGGQGVGEDISEAEAMKRYLISRGIEGNRILMEDKSTNTKENIQYSKAIINDTNKTVAIVTNGFHVYRATGIAKKQGYQKVEGLAAPSEPVLLINYYVREVLAVIKDKMVGNM